MNDREADSLLKRVRNKRLAGDIEQALAGLSPLLLSSDHLRHFVLGQAVIELSEFPQHHISVQKFVAKLATEAESSIRRGKNSSKSVSILRMLARLVGYTTKLSPEEIINSDVYHAVALLPYIEGCNGDLRLIVTKPLFEAWSDRLKRITLRMDTGPSDLRRSIGNTQLRLIATMEDFCSREAPETVAEYDQEFRELKTLARKLIEGV